MASGQPDYTRQVAVTVIDTPDTINVEVANTSPPLNVTFPSTQDVNVLAMPASSTVAVASVPSNMTTVPAQPYIPGRTYTYEDASFLTGETNRVLDVNTKLGRNSHDGYIVNDGPGDIQYSISDNGTDYGSAHTLKKDETVKLTHLDIHDIKLTCAVDSAYRVMVV